MGWEDALIGLASVAGWYAILWGVVDWVEHGPPWTWEAKRREHARQAGRARREDEEAAA